jgi:hypothetical protein
MRGVRKKEVRRIRRVGFHFFQEGLVFEEKSHIFDELFHTVFTQ